jgi:hypothetical protein
MGGTYEHHVKWNKPDLKWLTDKAIDYLIQPVSTVQTRLYPVDWDHSFQIQVIWHVIQPVFRLENGFTEICA